MSGAALVGLALAGALAGAQLEARLDPAQITVGDRVEVELVVTAPIDPEEDELEPPAWGDRWGEAEILAVAALQPRPGGDGLAWRQVVTVTAFRPGTVELPPVELRWRSADAEGALTTPQGLAFEVRSLLAEADGPLEPRPPEPPQPLPLAQAFWWTAAALGLGCLAAAVAVARRRRDAAAASEPDPLSACLRGIESAASRSSTTTGFTELSLALRAYLAIRLRLPALESTTPEIGQALGGVEGGADWEGLLARCDEARFSGREPSREALRASCRQARRLAESLAAKRALQEEDTRS